MTNALIAKISACRLCHDQLELGARPVFQIHKDARILIAGQAPGARVHASGIPFDDASGDRLRHWMGIDRDTFYDARQVAILPMAFCYPGKGVSGDKPPMPICAETWREEVLRMLGQVRLKLLVGGYAQQWHLPMQKGNLTDTVKNWRSLDSSTIALPHPSPRNNIWLKRNPWFETELLPVLKQRVSSTLSN